MYSSSINPFISQPIDEPNCFVLLFLSLIAIPNTLTFLAKI